MSRATLHNREEVRRRDIRVGDLVRVRGAMDIQGLGGETAAARDLAERFGSIQAIVRANGEQLQRAPGVGRKVAHEIRRFFDEPQNRAVAEALLAAAVRIVPPPRRRKGSLAGLTFVFTGTLDQLAREEAKRLVESLGARTRSSVTGATDYVVVGRTPGEKLEDARRRGIRILTEGEFRELLRRAGAAA